MYSQEKVKKKNIILLFFFFFFKEKRVIFLAFSLSFMATCSTAWSAMMRRNFDPFHWAGGDKPELKTPPNWKKGNVTIPPYMKSGYLGI
jgi:hypothetical protein